MRRFFLNSRNYIFDILGIGRGVEGTGQETFSMAPAHGESHSDDHGGQNDQPSQPQNEPREGFVF